MGSYLSINLEDQYKKNEKFLQTLNEIAMERQIQLRHQMLQRQKAMEIAKNRDMVMWFTAFYLTAGTALITGFRRTKRSYLLLPLVPLTFVDLYFWDAAYGNKVHRIKMEAEHIMTHESDMLDIPCGLPTPSSVDQGRLEEEEKKKIHPPLP